MSIYKDNSELSRDFEIFPHNLVFNEAVEYLEQHLDLMKSKDLISRDISHVSISFSTEFVHKILFTSQTTGKLLVSIR